MYNSKLVKFFPYRVRIWIDEAIIPWYSLGSYMNRRGNELPLSESSFLSFCHEPYPNQEEKYIKKITNPNNFKW